MEPREIADLVLYQIGALERDREGRRCHAPACEAARRALQHERPPRRYRRSDRARGRVIRRLAAAHGAAGIGAACRPARGWGFASPPKRLPIGPTNRTASLTPRHLSGCGADRNRARAAERAVRMVRDGKVVGARWLDVFADGRYDLRAWRYAGAAELAAAVRAGLEQSGR